MPTFSSLLSSNSVYIINSRQFKIVKTLQHQRKTQIMKYKDLTNDTPFEEDIVCLTISHFHILTFPLTGFFVHSWSREICTGHSLKYRILTRLSTEHSLFFVILSMYFQDYKFAMFLIFRFLKSYCALHGITKTTYYIMYYY